MQPGAGDSSWHPAGSGHTNPGPASQRRLGPMRFGMVVGGGWRHGRCTRGETHAVQDSSRHFRMINGRYKTHPPRTARTFQNVQSPNPLHQFSPWIIRAMPRVLGRRCRRLWRSCGFRCGFCGAMGDFRNRLTLICVRTLGAGCSSSCRHDRGSPFRGRGKDSRIAKEMRFGSGNDRDKFFHQFQWFQNHMCRSVTPWTLEPVE